MLGYCANLSSGLSDKQVKDALLKSIDRKLHDLKPGDWIAVRDLRKIWRAPRWNRPYQGLLTTERAVKVAQRTTWIHASHCSKVPEPGEDSSEQSIDVSE